MRWQTPAWVMILLAIVPCLPAQGFLDATFNANINLPPDYGADLGRGPCWGDFDGDDDLDMVFPAGGGSPIYYYRNNGLGTFADVSATSGLGNSPTRPKACVAADIDNDGDRDLFLAAQFERNRLYINDGSGVFTEEATARGVEFTTMNTFTASFGDYDRDGWVDLYIGNYTGTGAFGQPNQLMRNTGGGYFMDVAPAAGVADTGLCFTGIFHDYNDDGWPDIFVGNDKGWYPFLAPDTTYRNNGDGTFTDVGVAVNTRFGIGAMGSDCTDVFNDGGWDIFVSNTNAGHLFHVWNPATQLYDELAAFHGVAAYSEGWATNFFDYDNDGWQDLLVVHSFDPNHLYRNPGLAGGTWTNVAPSLGCGIPNATKYTSAIGDFDNDGRVDILIPMDYQPGVLLRNTVNGGNWVRFKLEGTVSNRSAIGARVAITVGGVTQRQTVRTGHGYIGGHDLRLHFGVGGATTVDSVSISWPSGHTQILTGLATNQDHAILEPVLYANGTPTTGSTLPLQLLSTQEPNAAFLVGLSGSATTGLPLGDGRTAPIDLDALLTYTSMPGNGVLPTPGGNLNSAGAASIPVQVPGLPALSGLTVYAAAVTGNPAAPLGIASVIGPLPLTIQ